MCISLQPQSVKPTKYHFYPHNQHIYLLPECAIQQVRSDIFCCFISLFVCVFFLLSFWFFFHHLTIGVLCTWCTFLCTVLAQPDFRVQRILAIIPFANSVLHICGVRMRAHFGRYGEEKGHLIHFNRTESSIKGQLN